MPTSPYRLDWASFLEELPSGLVSGELAPSGCRLFTKHGELSVRVGLPTPEHREFQFGLFRFKTTRVVPHHAFLIGSNAGAVQLLSWYIIPGGTLGTLRSLNLRFIEFERAHKWSAFRGTTRSITAQS